jgi:hypothetical protein
VGEGSGPGEFNFGPPYPFFGSPTDIAWGDVDGDAHPDLLLTTAGGGSDAGHVFLGNGDGTFQSDVVITAPSGPVAIAVADIDVDGVDDVAMAGSSGTLAMYLATDDGFGPAQQVTCSGGNPRQLAIGDLNGDCVGDVVTVTIDDGLCLMLSGSP